MHRPRAEAPIKIGISACLLGEMVRYDGGHKRNTLIVDTLAPFVEWVPVCPEVELGLGIPREPIHLVSAKGGTRLVGSKSGADHTSAMRTYARKRVAALVDAELCGYVLKEGSPSCGTRVRVHGNRVERNRTGRGLFAAALMEALPLLPVEEEGSLNDPRQCENFIERAFAYRLLRELFHGRWRRAEVVAFHAAHASQLVAHSPRHHARLGRLMAAIKRLPRGAFRARYQSEFMSALQVGAAARHA